MGYPSNILSKKSTNTFRRNHEITNPKLEVMTQRRHKISSSIWFPVSMLNTNNPRTLQQVLNSSDNSIIRMLRIKITLNEMNSTQRIQLKNDWCESSVPRHLQSIKSSPNFAIVIGQEPKFTAKPPRYSPGAFLSCLNMLTIHRWLQEILWRVLTCWLFTVTNTSPPSCLLLEIAQKWRNMSSSEGVLNSKISLFIIFHK